MGFFVAAHTLGCKVNQCDTENLLERLANIGCGIRSFKEKADLYIINTCTVTHTGDKKSRQMIRRVGKHAPGALVAVCGCMTKSDPTIAQALGVDYVFDARAPEDFLEEIARLTQEFTKIPQQPNVEPGSDLAEPSTHANQSISATEAIEGQHNPYNTEIRTRTRAFIKIQDGCDRFCSYCIVPHVRGTPVSRPLADIIAEAQALIANGVQEIVITGIQVASYGEDLGNTNLAKLVRQLISLKNLKSLRLSSFNPCAVTDEFLQIIASSDILCSHFHLSLQSGCDATLARMNRRYTTKEYATAVDALRNIRPNAAFTTDVMVGFPGETDAEFAQTLEFVQKIGFMRIHVFEFSRRKGTPAATFPGQIPDKVKTERSQKIRDAAAQLQLEFYKAQVGKILPVLFEKEKPAGTWHGHTSTYCPVEVISKTNLANTIRNVEITAASYDGIQGRIGV